MPPSANHASIAKYRAKAAGYDASARRTMALRARTIAALNLQPGDVVVDVGCGTGLSLPALTEGVGPAGHVIGIDQSPEMIALARSRAAAAGWHQVTLIESPAEDAILPRPFDAILFNYTHDILRSDRALARLFASARPGARVAVAGIKYFPAWLAPLNVYVYLKNRPYNALPHGLHRPWQQLQAHVPDLAVTPTQFGMGYLGRGSVPARTEA